MLKPPTSSLLGVAYFLREIKPMGVCDPPVAECPTAFLLQERCNIGIKRVEISMIIGHDGKSSHFMIIDEWIMIIDDY